MGDFLWPILRSIALLSATSVFAMVVLAPAVGALRGRRRRRRFHLVDYFSLTFLLALLIAAVTLMSRRAFPDVSRFARLILTLLGPVTIYLWWRSATTLSTLGVAKARSRFLFVGVMTPFAFVTSALVLPYLVTLIFEARSRGEIVFAVVALGLAAQLALTARRLTRRLICSELSVVSAVENVTENDSADSGNR